MTLILTLPTCKSNSTIFIGYVVSNQIKYPIRPLDSRPGGVSRIYIPPLRYALVCTYEWKSGRVPVRFGTRSLWVTRAFLFAGLWLSPSFRLRFRSILLDYAASNQIKHPICPLDSRPGSARRIYTTSQKRMSHAHVVVKNSNWFYPEKYRSFPHFFEHTENIWWLFCIYCK